MTLAALHTDDAAACAALGPVLIMVWRRPPTHDVVDRITPAFARCAATIPGPFAFLCVIEPTSPPPETAVRQRIEALLDGYPRLVRSVAVFERQPSWLAWGIEIASMLADPRGLGRRTKVCVDLREGIRWLVRDETLVPASMSAELEDAVARIRATLPPPE